MNSTGCLLYTSQLAKMMSLARQGIQSLIAKQQALLGTLALRQ